MFKALSSLHTIFEIKNGKKKRKDCPTANTEEYKEPNMDRRLKRGKIARIRKNLKKIKGKVLLFTYLNDLVDINLDQDSDYEDFKFNSSKEIKKKKHVIQGWKVVETISNTYYQKYVDSLIRYRKWHFKAEYAEYAKDGYYVLKYAEGINCQYKKRITVGKEKIELPDCFQGNFKVNI